MQLCQMSLESQNENCDILTHMQLCHSSSKKKKKNPSQWFITTLRIRIPPPSHHTHALKYTYRTSINSYVIRLLPPLQPQLHHCSSWSLILDFFPVLRWVPIVHSKDSQTSMCVRIVCISNKFPGDGAANLWTILLSSKNLKNILSLPPIFYSSSSFNLSYHFLKRPKIIRNSSSWFP